MPIVPREKKREEKKGEPFPYRPIRDRNGLMQGSCALGWYMEKRHIRSGGGRRFYCGIRWAQNTPSELSVLEGCINEMDLHGVGRCCIYCDRGFFRSEGFRRTLEEGNGELKGWILGGSVPYVGPTMSKTVLDRWGHQHIRLFIRSSDNTP